MVLQLTNYAIGILGTNPAPVLDAFKIGSGVNYVPQPTDTDIHGALLFSGIISQPIVISANVVKYTIAMDTSVGDFDWGEVGFFYQGGLFALAAGNTLQSKTKIGVGPGNQTRLDAFLSVVGTNYQMIVDQADSNSQFQMASLSTVDQLPPTNQTTPNAYIISAAASNQTSFLAFTDRVGLWAFDSYQFASGAKATITSADTLSVTIALSDFAPTMAPTYFGEVIAQFITGKNYSINRYVASAVQSGSSVVLGFNTPLALLPDVGDKIEVFSRVAQSATLEIPIATASVLGGIKIGTGLIVAADGTCSINAATLNAVTLVNGKGPGVVNLVATDIPGFGAVAYSNNYADLNGKPDPYTLPLMALNIRGGAKLPTSGNLVMSGEQLELGFAPVKKVNNVLPDANGNVSLTALVVGLVNPTVVPSAADLNAYTTAGLFTISSAVISTLSNSPALTGAATLEVVPLTTGGSGDSVQRFTQEATMFWRKNTGATWGAWNQVANNSIATTTTVGVIKVGAGLLIDTQTGNLTPRLATSAQTGVIKAGNLLSVQGDGTLDVTLPIASASTLGAVKQGTGVVIDANGVLSVDPNTLPLATTTQFGVVKIGLGIAVSAGVISIDANNLPTATTTTLGVVKVPASGGLTVSPDGSLAVDNSQLPIATTIAKGIMQVGAGLSVTTGVVSANLRTVNGVSPDGSGNVVVAPSPDATKLNVVNGVAQGIRLSFTDLGSIAGGGTVSVDQANANAMAATFSAGAVTWAFAGFAGGVYCEVQMEVINGGTATHTFPAAVKFVKPDGTLTNSLSDYMTAQRGATNFQTSGVDFLCLWSRDGGTNIYAKVL